MKQADKNKWTYYRIRNKVIGENVSIIDAIAEYLDCDEENIEYVDDIEEVLK